MALIETTRGDRPYYIVRWNYRDRSIDGKPYDERAFRDDKKAEAWHKKTRRSPTTKTGKGRVATLLDTWLEEHVSQLEKRTYATNESVIRLHIKPGIGAKAADRLTARECSQWLRRMQANGSSAATADKARRVARAAFRWARGEGITHSRVLEDVAPPRDTRSAEQKTANDPVAYTAAELRKLVKACKLQMESTIILVGKDSGLRRSELFALRWDKVDLRKGLIHVHRTLDLDGTDKDPKTHERRTVPLLADGLQALKEWRAVCKPAKGSTDRVFCQKDGKPLSTVWESRHAGKKAKRRPTKKAGTKGGPVVEVVTPGIRSRSGIWLELNHLRDTYASTLLFVAKATPEELRMALGHKNVQTTLDHYAVWLEPSRDDLARRANADMERVVTSHR